MLVGQVMGLLNRGDSSSRHALFKNKFRENKLFIYVISEKSINQIGAFQAQEDLDLEMDQSEKCLDRGGPIREVLGSRWTVDLLEKCLDRGGPIREVLGLRWTNQRSAWIEVDQSETSLDRSGPNRKVLG